MKKDYQIEWEYRQQEYLGTMMDSSEKATDEQIAIASEWADLTTPKE